MNKVIDPLLSKDLESFAKLSGSSLPSYSGVNFKVMGKILSVGIAVLDGCPALGVKSYIGTLPQINSASQRVNFITGARGPHDLTISLASFIAGMSFNDLTPIKGAAFENVFDCDKMCDAVLVDPFPFKHIAVLPGETLYVMPITASDRGLLISEGAEAFESRQVSTHRDVFELR